jgi:hypothetical protein
MAGSPWSGWRPRPPVGAAAEDISGSNRIVAEPRRRSASSQAGQFPVLRAGGRVACAV